jgi:biopolymer transport protein ExbD
MAMKLDDNEGAISEINVVPLVDIILVVLIIFMVTAPMIMKPSINVNLPKAAAGDKTAPSLLNIVIGADGKLSLNGAISDENAISNKAQEAVAQNPDVQAIISADKETPHGTVVHIIDIVKVAGVKKFAISIEKSK